MYMGIQMCAGEVTFNDARILSIKKALKGEEKNEWLKAIEELLQYSEDNIVWELDDPPRNCNIVKCKWVLRKKNMTVKIRLVAKGFLQKQGVDYSETFSLVAGHTTLRTFFAFSVKLNLVITPLDATRTFLNTDLDDAVCMEKPD